MDDKENVGGATKSQMKKKVAAVADSRNGKEKEKLKSKKGKKYVDGDESKERKPQARSAYIFFSTEQRPLIKLENAELGFADIAKEIGNRWK